MDAAVEQMLATMHGIEALPTPSAATLGPILKSVVKLDSKPVDNILMIGQTFSEHLSNL